VDGHAPPLQAIPALARHHLAKLLTLQPDGPVLLGGWSSGGLVAYEMAVQLRAMGRQVAGVALLDCPAPLVHDTVPDPLLFDWFIGDLHPAAPALDDLKRIDRGASLTQQLQQVALCLRQHGMDLGTDATALQAIYCVFSGMVRGGRDYSAAASDLALLVVRAGRVMVAEFSGHPHADDADWGWGTISNGAIRTEQFDATHYTLLAAPHAGRLADIIEHWSGKPT
jgi:thioesterase domain-containing protein